MTAMENAQISGLLLIDKPVGITSFDVVRILRKQLNTRKIGHAGTLDPFASGLMLIALGSATKALSHLLSHDKTYRTRIIFGVVSDTLDRDGKIERLKNPDSLIGKKVADALCLFTGNYLQMPPAYSAKKIDGKRACDRMRMGEEVTLQPSTVKCDKIELLEFGIEKDGEFAGLPYAEIQMHVGSGFYVRSFARDLGETLNTGAVASELRRESLGRFEALYAKKPEEASVQDIFSVSPADFEVPVIILNVSEFEEIVHGRKISVEKNLDGEIAMFYQKRWVGFGSIENGAMRPKRVVI